MTTIVQDSIVTETAATAQASSSNTKQVIRNVRVETNNSLLRMMRKCKWYLYMSSISSSIYECLHEKMFYLKNVYNTVYLNFHPYANYVCKMTARNIVTLYGTMYFRIFDFYAYVNQIKKERNLTSLEITNMAEVEEVFSKFREKYEHYRDAIYGTYLQIKYKNFDKHLLNRIDEFLYE
tara:strand:+ start:1241 stop:1777 length:537 start_codon:yes stop_codon:yes gene_type:complete